jgi:bacterioferritin-associated ferredoxin
MTDNPLKQYFRRPSIYFKLPSEGKYYGPDVVNIPPNDELPVYPMTSIDEITVKTPDGLFNGAAIVSVITSCIPDIKDPWKLNSIDMEACIIAIRAASMDGKIDVGSTCPKCENSSTYSVNLMNLLMDKVKVDYDTPLKIRDLEIKFKPLTYAETNKHNVDQFQIQRTILALEKMEDENQRNTIMSETITKMNEMMNNVLCDTIESIKTPETTVIDRSYIREFLTSCDGKTSNTIKEYSTNLRQANDTKPLKVTCTECGNEYKQPLVLNFTDFFA